MIAVQVAVSVVLLISAGAAGRRACGNCRTRRVATTPTDVTVMRHADRRAAPARRGPAPTYQQYLQQVAAVPGVAHAAMADAPLPGSDGMEFAIIGRPDDAATLAMQRASWRIVSDDYFERARHSNARRSHV